MEKDLCMMSKNELQAHKLGLQQARREIGLMDALWFAPGEQLRIEREYNARISVTEAELARR